MTALTRIRIRYLTWKVRALCWAMRWLDEVARSAKHQPE
jgi:hypothetical protein